ncbi:hypothetical protein PENSPDRAFT_627823 [Peniophora sp. CONT]|nr:hypothetical protein PENSPDRAFT_627823 [Peniophora sp. CONT]
MSYYSQPQPGPAPHEMTVPQPPQPEKRSAPEPVVNGSGSKRRRTALTVDRGDGEEDEDDGDANTGGGARHWTDDEKGTLFEWLMGPGSDDHFEALRTKKNTCFRECAQEAFGGRKTFLAIKGCYERNFAVFKNVYAFEEFTSNMQPPSTMDPDSEVDRVREFERRIYAARRAGFNLGSLTSRLLDHWHQMGWYKTFHSRWHNDPSVKRPSQGQIQVTSTAQMPPQPASQLQSQQPHSRPQTMAPPTLNPSPSPRYQPAEPTPIRTDALQMPTMSSRADGSMMHASSSRTDGAFQAPQRSDSMMSAMHEPLHMHDDYQGSSETLSPPETPAFAYAPPPPPLVPLGSMAGVQTQQQQRRMSVGQHQQRQASPPLSAPISLPNNSVFTSPSTTGPSPSSGFDALIVLSECVKQLSSQVRDIAEIARRADERARNNDAAGRAKAKSETAMEVLANPHVPDEYKTAAGEYLKKFFAMD